MHWKSYRNRFDGIKCYSRRLVSPYVMEIIMSDLGTCVLGSLGTALLQPYLRNAEEDNKKKQRTRIDKEREGEKIWKEKETAPFF